jgi:hypothetical protein
MNRTWKGPIRWLGGFGLAAVLSLAQAAIPAHPGMLNYVEGQVAVGNSSVTAQSVGSADLTAGQVLRTGSGKAEILLTPGVFLRVGNHSAVRMISPALTDTRVELLQGKALVEVTQLSKNNDISVVDQGLTAKLDKNGLYGFQAEPATVRVYDGKADVTAEEGHATVKKGKELSLAGPFKVQSFDRKADEATDDLYKWSSLRSGYLAQASLASAQTIVVNNTGWYGPGWYWNPFWGTYSFIPGSGMLYSPFGYGFYSPYWAYSVPSVIYVPTYRNRVPNAPGAVFGNRWPRASATAPSVRAAPSFGRSSGSFGMRGGMASGLGRR